ncbi:hypothetical protein [Saccharopolyspora sp. NPDC002376]
MPSDVDACRAEPILLAARLFAGIGQYTWMEVVGEIAPGDHQIG